MELPCEGLVLLVGDGDFSFTVSLMKKLSLKASQVTTSSLETLDSIQQHTLAAENMKVLTEMGVQVCLETDARELHTHTIISQCRYDRVIFNFPLADRHNIKKNRALLADFFSSCSQILSDAGCIMVTLCKGQGGTPADQPMRSWPDSWQVHAMATNAGFILNDVMPFESSKYPEYHSVGFRFQDKSFNTDGALTHIFVKADMMAVNDDVCARGCVQSSNSNYTCSRYLAEKMDRHLLQEENNPLCLLRKRLEVSINHDLGAKIIQEKPDLCILPGHKSRVLIDANVVENILDTTIQFNADCNESNNYGDAVKRVKERKNEANLVIAQNAMSASLLHGVDRVSSENHVKTLSQQHDSKLHQYQDEKLLISKFIPENPESVFILIKGNVDSGANSGKDVENQDCSENKMLDNVRDECTTGNSDDCTAGIIVVPSLSESVECNTGSSKDDDGTADIIVQSLSGSDECNNLEICEGNSGNQVSHFLAQHIPEIQVNALSKETDLSCQGQETDVSCLDRVFHCRTSLLENLSDLSVNDISRKCQFVREEMSACSKSVQPSLSADLIDSRSEVCEMTPQVKSDVTKICDGSSLEFSATDSQCFVISGQCFLPGPIIPATLASRHEMMYVQNIESNNCVHVPQENAHNSKQTFAAINNFKENGTPLVNNNRNTEHQGHLKHLQNYVSASEHLMSCLNTCDVFLHSTLSVQDTNDTVHVKLDGFDNVSNIKLILIEAELPTEEAAKLQPHKDFKVVVGVMFQVANSSNNMLVAILQLDTIACRICNICDPRLVWSRSERFINQFCESSFPQTFSPFSLYPMMFAHDFSFWEKDSDSQFDISEMYSIIRYIAGDLVCKVSLIDLYTDPNTGQCSRCYRLHFTSQDLVLPYLISWKLQSLIRIEVAQKLEVTLR